MDTGNRSIQNRGDGRPIADLFRDGRRIPKGARDTPAELFHPGNPPLLNVRLKLVPTLTPEKEALLHTELVAVMNYDRLRADGMSGPRSPGSRL